MSTRTEHDTMGNVEVPSEAYWGAQTQRSRNNFKIGGETLPQPLIYALALVKKAAAATNVSLGRIKPEQADLITQAADGCVERQARRAVSFSSMADRLRHAIQYEHERSTGEPRQRNCRYGLGSVSARPSQRPCEPRAIDQ